MNINRLLTASVALILFGPKGWKEVMKDNKMYIVNTINRKTRESIVTDIFCKEHWKEAKKMSPWQNDANYKMEAKESDNSELKCSVCELMK